MATGGAPGLATSDSQEIIWINFDSAECLELIPGVSRTLAKTIVQLRRDRGNLTEEVFFTLIRKSPTSSLLEILDFSPNPNLRGHGPRIPLDSGIPKVEPRTSRLDYDMDARISIDPRQFDISRYSDYITREREPKSDLKNEDLSAKSSVRHVPQKRTDEKSYIDNARRFIGAYCAGDDAMDRLQDICDITANLIKEKVDGAATSKIVTTRENQPNSDLDRSLEDGELVEDEVENVNNSDGEGKNEPSREVPISKHPASFNEVLDNGDRKNKFGTPPVPTRRVAIREGAMAMSSTPLSPKREVRVEKRSVSYPAPSPNREVGGGVSQILSYPAPTPVKFGRGKSQIRYNPMYMFQEGIPRRDRYNSEGEMSLAAVLKLKPKGLTYDGVSNLKAFRLKFDQFVAELDLTERLSRTLLNWCLVGKASDYLTILLEKSGDLPLTKIWEKLELRFDWDFAQSARFQFYEATQKKDESLQEFAERLTKLASIAFKTLPDNYVNTQITERFCQGLTNKQLGYDVASKSPTSTEDAIREVQRLMLLRKLHFGESSSSSSVDIGSVQIRQVSGQEDNQSDPPEPEVNVVRPYPQGKSFGRGKSSVQSGSAPADRDPWLAALARLGKKFDDLALVIKGSRTRTHQKRGDDIVCFLCAERGHIAKNCQANPLNAIGAEGETPNQPKKNWLKDQHVAKNRGNSRGRGRGATSCPDS